jgi:hypothetical protein
MPHPFHTLVKFKVRRAGARGSALPQGASCSAPSPFLSPPPSLSLRSPSRAGHRSPPSLHCLLIVHFRLPPCPTRPFQIAATCESDFPIVLLFATLALALTLSLFLSLALPLSKSNMFYIINPAILPHQVTSTEPPESQPLDFAKHTIVRSDDKWNWAGLTFVVSADLLARRNGFIFVVQGADGRRSTSRTVQSCLPR